MIVDMSGKRFSDLPKDEQEWLKDNHSLLRRRVVDIVKKHKGPERPCNTDIAKGLFPPDGDYKQNFTCQKLLLHKVHGMNGRELISERKGRYRYWCLNPRWHPKEKKEKL